MVLGRRKQPRVRGATPRVECQRKTETESVMMVEGRPAPPSDGNGRRRQVASCRTALCSPPTRSVERADGGGLVAALQLDRDADVTNRLWGCFVGSLTRLSQRIGSSRLDATSNTTTQQTQVGRIYSAGGRRQRRPNI